MKDALARERRCLEILTELPLRRYRRAQSPDLLQHPELIPVVPALDDLTVGEAGERHAPQSYRTAAARRAHRVTGMLHDTRPAQHSLVAGGKDVFYRELHVGKRAADFPHKSFELLGAVKLGFGGLLSVGDSLGREQFVNGFDSAL